MSLLDRARTALRVLREGYDPAGGNIDPDDNLYRRLTGGERDLTPMAQDRAREVAFYLWERNPLAKRLTELMVDFVVGDGIAFAAPDERVEAVIDTFWHDPAMRLDLRHRDFVRDLSITGELAVRLFPGLRPRIGYIGQERIKDVQQDPDNLLIDTAVVLRQTAGQPERTLRVANPPADDPDDGLREGDVLYYSVNRLTTGSRGRPDLLALADFIDGYDQVLWNTVERTGFLNAFVWDVTLTGADKAEVQEWIAAHPAAPAPGTQRVHNEKEVWDSKAPALGASEIETVARLVKNTVLGGAGVPEGWFGDGDSANRATLAAQGDPTYKMLAARQRYVRFMLEDLLAWVVDSAIAAGALPSSVDRTVVVMLPDPNDKDAKGIAGALQPLASALGSAVDAEFISTEHARRLFLTLAGQMGVDLDEDEVEAAIEEERAAREEEQMARGLDPAAWDLDAEGGQEPPESPAPGQPALAPVPPPFAG